MSWQNLQDTYALSCPFEGFYQHCTGENDNYKIDTCASFRYCVEKWSKQKGPTLNKLHLHMLFIDIPVDFRFLGFCKLRLYGLKFIIFSERPGTLPFIINQFINTLCKIRWWYLVFTEFKIIAALLAVQSVNPLPCTKKCIPTCLGTQ